MLLSTHIIIATVASKHYSQNLFLVFAISVISHFLSDMLPHWDYDKDSVAYERDLGSGKLLPYFKKFNIGKYFSDFLKFFFDGMIGVLVAFFFIPDASVASILFLATAIVGGVLPDLLQGFYSTGKFDFLRPLQVFHAKSHWWKKYDFLRRSGWLFQFLLALVFIYIGIK